MNVLRSEWTKFRSVRSTWLTILSTVAAGTALSALGTSDLLGAAPSELPGGWDPTAEGLKGFLFAHLLIGMLGALSITAEYGTGMIATSLVAVPDRSRLLGAKAVVVAGAAFGTAAVTTLVSFTVVQVMLGGAGLPAAGPGDPGVVGALAAGTLYLTLVALIGVAVGVLTRSTTGSLAVLVGGLLLVPAIAPGLPGLLGEWFARFWPTSAGQAAYTVVPVDGMLGRGAGLAVLALAAAGIVLAGHICLRSRDV